jgi:hypothetical protein
MSLRDLDDKYLPELGRRLDRLTRKFPKPPPPTGPLPVILRLRRWDDRWTGAGPLALLRDVPQLGGMLLALLILVGGVTVSQRAERTAPPAAAQEPDDPTDPTDDIQVGPRLGEEVGPYLDATRQALLRSAGGEPDGVAWAVVHFNAYKTPEEARRLLGSLEARMVLYRAPLKLPRGEQHYRLVKDLVADTRTAFQRRATSNLAEARRLRRESATIENDPAQVDSNLAEARSLEREAAVYRGACRCVYSVVVRGQYRALVEIVNLPGVRGVDASGDKEATFEELSFTGLLPEDRARVTAGSRA